MLSIACLDIVVDFVKKVNIELCCVQQVVKLKYLTVFIEYHVAGDYCTEDSPLLGFIKICKGDPDFFVQFVAALLKNGVPVARHPADPHQIMFSEAMEFC